MFSTAIVGNDASELYKLINAVYVPIATAVSAPLTNAIINFLLFWCALLVLATTDSNQ